MSQGIDSFIHLQEMLHSLKHKVIYTPACHGSPISSQANNHQRGERKPENPEETPDYEVVRNQIYHSDTQEERVHKAQKL